MPSSAWSTNDEFYGDRTATVADYTWNLASRIEEVSPSAIQARWDQMMTQSA